MVKSYKELNVWQHAIEFVDAIYEVTLAFPSEEKFGLSSQIRCAAVSIPSNIAEGAERHNTKEFIQFIGIAKGSLAEVETQLLIAMRRQYMKTAKYEQLDVQAQTISKMLHGLSQSLRNK